MMVWSSAGRTPRDQAVWSCQSPLPGLIQALMGVSARSEKGAQNSREAHSSPRVIFMKDPFPSRIITHVNGANSGQNTCFVRDKHPTSTLQQPRTRRWNRRRSSRPRGIYRVNGGTATEVLNREISEKRESGVLTTDKTGWTLMSRIRFNKTRRTRRNLKPFCTCQDLPAIDPEFQ